MDEVIRKNCLAVEVMADLEESECCISQGNFSSFLKMTDELLNSESLWIQFGNADVYDSSAISLNRNRIPCSMVRNDKNKARKGKGTGCKGQLEVHWADLGENAGESDNHYSQVEFGNDGGNDYRDNWG